MGDTEVDVTRRLHRSPWWTWSRGLGLMWTTFGFGTLAVFLVAAQVVGEQPTLYFIAVAVLWGGGGLLLLARIACIPRVVQAAPDGVYLDRGPVSFLPWQDVLRTQTLPFGSDAYDVWLETTRNQLVRLPDRVPGGTVEGWRVELDAQPPTAPLRVRSTWARAPLSPGDELQLPQLLLWPYLLSSLLAGNSVTVLAATAAIAAGAAAALLLRRPPPVLASPTGVTVRRYRRTLTVPWSAIADVRRRKGRWYAPFALVLHDGSEVPLPSGLTPDVVDSWARDHAQPGPSPFAT